MNSQLHPRRHKPPSAAHESPYACGIAHCAVRVEIRLQLLPGAFQCVARFVEQLVVIAAARDSMCNADVDPLLMNQPAKFNRAL
jgi:hypothetical protein